ncbi:MAG: hypothetical protein MUF83_18865 [Acidimicrobiales bacterium]|jgi:predicted nuclease with TOPRIM domain|nr:hypothetical protein [Acidimicrobiales bacterium]
MELQEIPNEVVRIARDAVYITIGMGVIAYQNLQSGRHELEERLEAQVTETREQLGSLDKAVETIGHRFEDQTHQLEERLAGVEQRFEELLDEFEDHLPDQAQHVVAQARDAARDARGQLRTLVSRAA